MSSYYGDRPRDVPSWETLERGDEDEILQAEYAYAARDHVLFCIDASSSMRRPAPDEENEGGYIRGKSALHQVLEAIVEIERRKVITGPADSVGLLLWNVDPDKLPADSSSRSSNYKPGTMVFQNLQTINAEEIKRILKVVESANDQYAEQEDGDGKTVEPASLQEIFPPCQKGEELNIGDVLTTCNFVFRDAGTRMAGNKRVFLVTDNDQPPGSTNPQPAKTIFTDLSAYDVTINTFFLDRPGHKFNPTLFWNNVLGRDADEDSPGDADPEEEGLKQLREIMKDLVIKNTPKRVQFSIPLKFGGKSGEIEIGVAGYSLVSEQGKGQPKYVRMRGQTVEEVVTRSEYTSAETGAVLREEEIGHAYQFGNDATVRNVLDPNWWESDEQIAQNEMIADEILKRDMDKRRAREENGDEEEEDVEMGSGEGAKGKNGKQTDEVDEKPKIIAKTRLHFTEQEVAEFKSMGMEPQIRILGFQSPENLSVDENIKHSYFIYPDETAYSGSTRTFAALLRSCAKFKRHALAICRFRRNNTPEICVLIPQEEVLTEDGKGQEEPPGFHVIVLPFADDIRNPPKNMTDNILATERQGKLMASIIKRLTSKRGEYISTNHKNPALAYHYTQLQALAFDEEFDPNSDDVQDQALPKYQGMHKVAGAFMQEWNESIAEDERAVESLKGATKRKAVTTVDVNEDDLEDIPGAWKKGMLTKMTVASLREWAKHKGIPLAGKTKKADIVEAIEGHLEKGDKGKH